MLIEKNVKIIQKPTISYFQHYNKKYIDYESIKIGRYVTAVNEMCNKTELNKLLLRTTLAVDPDSPLSNWTELVKQYYSNLNILVPINGLNLNVSIDYNVNDASRKRYIELVKNALKTTTITDEILSEYVEKHVDIADRPLYGRPSDEFHYISYIFCLLHREVANNIKDIDKSTNIKFYIYTEEDAKKAIEAENKLKLEISTLVAEFSKQPNKMIEVLRNYNLLNLEKQFEISKDTDKILQQFMLLAFDESVLFQSIIKDRMLQQKAFIQSLIEYKLIEYLMGSSVLVLTEDRNVIVGNDVSEAIMFFTQEKNQELKTRIVNQLNTLRGK